MRAGAVALAALGGTAGSAGADQQGQEQRGIQGVWNVTVTIRSCTTEAPLFTGRAVLMFNDGGTLAEISDRSNRSTGLGTWRHLGGNSFTALEEFIDYSAFGPGTFNGTEVITREIELSKNADEYTSTAMGEVYNAAGQLINTTCATATATRFE